MKRIVFLLAIFTLPLWVYSQATQTGPEMLPLVEFQADSSAPAESNQIISFKPVFPIRSALMRAEKFVKEKEVDLSDQYIHSVQLYYDAGSKRKGHYWHVQWIGLTPRLGREYALRIYMDGSVLPDPTGP